MSRVMGMQKDQTKAHVNLLKLCVGIESPENLADAQAKNHRLRSGGYAVHTTRMYPRREAELLNGGSLYWVIKGGIMCRQEIIRLKSAKGEDGVGRCEIILAPDVVSTAFVPRRPFQGWRYLDAISTPPDLTQGDQPYGQGDELPFDLAESLMRLGVC